MGSYSMYFNVVVGSSRSAWMGNSSASLKVTALVRLLPQLRLQPTAPRRA